jgi:hypothetical protein
MLLVQYCTALWRQDGWVRMAATRHSLVLALFQACSNTSEIEYRPQPVSLGLTWLKSRLLRTAANCILSAYSKHKTTVLVSVPEIDALHLTGTSRHTLTYESYSTGLQYVHYCTVLYCTLTNGTCYLCKQNLLVSKSLS